MKNSVDITELVKAIISIMAMVISYFIIPWLKAKLSEARWDNLCKWTSAAVKAAEVLFTGTGLGDKKREYVMSRIKYICDKNGYSFDEDDLRIAVENAWKDMAETKNKENGKAI